MTLTVGSLVAFLKLDGLSSTEAGIAGVQRSLDLTGKSATLMGATADKAMTSTAASSGKLRAAQLRTTAAQERYNALLKETEPSVAKLASAEATLISANLRVAATQDALNASMTESAVVTGSRFALSLQNAGKAAAGAGGALVNLGRMIIPVQSGFGLAAAAAAALGVVSIKAATDFQTATTRINTQAGASQAEVKNLSAGMLNLAGSVGTLPTTLADAAYHIESVGIRGSQALDVLKISAEGAKIGGANLTDVTNGLDAAIVSGIPGVENYSQAMGALNATVGAGDMTMQDLADALGTGVLAVIKQYGVNLGQASAALATFGDNNIRGAEAGTQLRIAVQALTKPAKTASDALSKLGLDGDDAFSHFAVDLQKGGLDLALKDLNDRLVESGNTGVKTGEILTDAFGKKAGVGLAILVGQYARYQQKEQEVAAGAKGFSQAWTNYTRTFSFAADAVKAEAEALGISLGEKLLPSATAAMHWIGTTGVADLKAGAKALSTILAELSPLGTALHQAGGAAGALGEDLKPLGKLLLGLGFGSVEESARILGAGIRVLGDIFQVIGDVARVAKPEIEGLAAAFVALKVASVLSAQWELLPTRIGLAGLAAKDAGVALKTNLVSGMSALASPAALATVGVGLLAAGIHQVMQNADAATASVKNWAEGLGASTDPTKIKSLYALNTAFGQNQALLDTTRAKYVALNDTLSGQTKATQGNYNALIGGTTQALKASIAEQGHLNEVLNASGGALNITAAQAYLLAQKYGVDLTKSAGDVTKALQGAADKAKDGTSSSKDLAAAEKAVGDNAGSAADMVQGLTDALAGLSGNAIDATKAQDNIVLAIGKLKDNLDSGSRSLDRNTIAGATNANALLDILDASEKAAISQAKAGGNTQQLTAQFDTNYASLKAAAAQLGITGSAFDALATAMHAVPREVDPTITANSQPAQAAIAGVNDGLNALNGKTATVTIAGDVQFLGLSKVQNQLANNLANKAIRQNSAGGRIVGPGTGTSDSILSWVSNGETVMTAAATRKYGALFDQMNAGAALTAKAPAGHGYVGSDAPAKVFNLNQTINPAPGMSEKAVGDAAARRIANLIAVS